MNKLLIAINLIAAILLVNTKANAQTDSTTYDLGRIQLSKKFTQAVTVKGADLEKYPFANLSDALNVWFYGINTNKQTVVYVIDGNVINDVNAYSIYDIEEASLIQNAAGQLNGAYAYKQLIVITTRRRHAGRSGIIASAQANVVKAGYESTVSGGVADNSKSTTGIYQQYYLSAFKNTDKLQAGLSADYQHDAQPYGYNSPSSISSKGQPVLSRVKLFGYADYKLFTGTVLGVKANYSTQNGSAHIVIGNPGGVTITDMKLNQHIIDAEAYIHSRIVSGLSNHLSVGYNNLSGIQDLSSPGYYTSTQIQYILSKYDVARGNFLIKDALSYNVNLGGFSVRPAVNFTYRRLKDTSSAIVNGPSFNSGQFSRLASKQAILTPSVDIAHKDYFNVQGGLVQLLSTDNFYTAKPKKTFPFVTGTISTANKIKGAQIKLFGSYSKFNNMFDFNGTLAGLDNLNITNTIIDNSNLGYYVDPYYIQLLNKAYTSYAFGAQVGFLNNKITLSYNYAKRKYTTLAYYTDPFSGQSTPIFPDANSISHRIEVGINVIEKYNVKWLTNLNASHNKQNIQTANYLVTNGITSLDKVWTGGWANRIEYRKFFAGADVLYMFSKDNYQSTTFITTHLDPFSLQNLYAGFTVKTPLVKNLQVYANARNVFQKVNALVTDDRYFYGVGFKAGF